MPTNNFLQFATADGNDAISDAAYAGLAARLLGFQNGIADPGQVSKAIRQGAAGSAMLGQIIVDHALADANDDGNTAAQKANLRTALAAMLAGSAFAQDTSSTANAIVVALDPAPPTLNSFRGLFVRVANTNTGPVTIALNTLGAKTATRHDGTPLQSGDVIAGQFSHFIYDSQLGMFVLAGVAPGEVPRLAGQNQTLYVRPDGSDSNDGSANTAAKAFLTPLAAANYGRTKFFLAGQPLTLQLGTPGVYAPPGNIDASGGSIILRGDPANQAAYNIQGNIAPSQSAALVASINGSVTTNGLTITNTGTTVSNAAAAGAGSISVTNTTFSTTTSGAPALLTVFSGGNAAVQAGCVFGGNAASMWQISSGYLTMAANVVLANSPNFTTATVFATNVGVFLLQGSYSFSGSGCTGMRFLGNLNSIFNTNGSGVNFFPGSAAGNADTTTGSRYA
ncbi:hypothetical protein [Methylobacterium fujisawaense]|uniref:hypothetical protein n=1 Tax=Methylobacterium fujisawaense TaxID=107400 RepID=UPI00313F0ACE